LVSKKTALKITGGEQYCSFGCLDEDGDYHKGYKFVDKSRFKLSGCNHFSAHVQCILTLVILRGDSWTCCPIGDSVECRSELVDHKFGPALYWGPEDFKNFF